MSDLPPFRLAQLAAKCELTACHPRRMTAALPEADGAEVAAAADAYERSLASADFLSAYAVFAGEHPELSRLDTEGVCLLLLLLRRRLNQGARDLELSKSALRSLLDECAAECAVLQPNSRQGLEECLTLAYHLLEQCDPAELLQQQQAFFAWDSPRCQVVADRLRLYPRLGFIITLAAACPFIERIAIAEAEFLMRYTAAYRCSYRLAHLEHLCLLVMLLDYQMQRGDVCLRLGRSDLRHTLQRMRESARSRGSPDLSATQRFFHAAARLLESLDTAALAADNPEFFAHDNPQAVLVIDTRLQRLYLRRYYSYECRIAAVFCQARQQLVTGLGPEAQDLIGLLFADRPAAAGVDWQKVAVCLALSKRIAIISGGPGTGKTTTVLSILLLLCARAGAPLRIALAAPTGKAAARMSESIAAGLANEHFLSRARTAARRLGRDVADLLAIIPRTAQTLHALLRIVPHHNRSPYGPAHPLPLDLLIVDEVSMVDMALFCRMVEALSADTRLIMLGDRDQLCSVEAGSVLGDLCATLGKARPCAAAPQLLEQLSMLSGYSCERLAGGQLSDYAVLLHRSYRFAEHSGIATLARITNDTQLAAADKLRAFEQCFNTPEWADSLQRRDYELSAEQDAALGAELVDSVLNEHAEDGYGPFLLRLRELDFTVHSEDEARQLTELMNRCRILCSNHAGRLGDHALNAAIEECVREQVGLFQEFYPGKIVLITDNDSVRHVYNGDVGFAAYDAQEPQRPLKVFVRNDTGFARIPPAFLAHYEPGFALTVHKSQGSEYYHVVIVLAPEDNLVLTKELVYTALTRARERITLYACRRVLAAAISRQVRRESALAERLQLPESCGIPGS